MDIRVVDMSASSSERQLPKKSFFRKVMDDIKADEKTNWKALFNSFIMFAEWIAFLTFIFTVLRLATSKLEYK
ncbi:Oidioi.mRNA.OKI2018_I69.chr1.g2502.t1.cds [Oikopleura dioica]|uniref:Oidioi.mRNA.OKI2018_I69.chr1.g2502.t1.cds n=1 Tax=Oikopleura dioica TaxID=34765 RepID=A0ABN7SVL8_OIKDI|nr:Oidioi.mRNA.OKI2018_I69.chr1.g2502.t1.cds [Oikopleura dioica]